MPPFFLSYPVHNLLFKRLSFPPVHSFPSADQIFCSTLPWLIELVLLTLFYSLLPLCMTVFCILVLCKKKERVMHLVASCTYVRICILPLSSNNHLNFVFFNRVVKLWNALPIIDLHLSISILKHNLCTFFWNYFIDHFNPHLIMYCTRHLVCPYSSCFTNPAPHNYSLLGCQY